MRFLIITNSVVPFGPNDVMFFRAAKILLEQGHEVTVSPYDWDGLDSPRYDELERLGASIHRRARYVPHKRFLIRQSQRLCHRLQGPWREYKFIESVRPDLILLNDPGTYSILGNKALCDYLVRPGVRFATFSQYNDESGALSGQQSTQARAVFARARAAFFVSERNLSVCQRQLCMDLPNACVVDNPPDFDDYAPVPFPPAGKLRMALVARLDCKVKCQDLVIDALAHESWCNRDWELTLYGSGPDEAYLRRLIEFRGLAEKVKLAGFSKSIREVWTDHHLLVLCSSGEGKPLAVTEAMLCGRAAVVSDVGGNAELVEHGKTGFVAKAPTVALIREALEAAWQRRSELDAMGRAAREFMLARLTPRAEVRFAAALIKMAETKPVCHE